MVLVHLLAGAAILCCGKLAASELHCLTAAPRLAIHEALATPHKYLGTPYELGLSSKMDDACIAYQLFLEVQRFLLAFLQALFSAEAITASNQAVHLHDTCESIT